MSESAARQMRDQRPAIDLEEFERRLRAPEPARRGEDPLAELARLVGTANDPFKDMFAGGQQPAIAAPVQQEYHVPAVQAQQAYPAPQAYHEMPAQELSPETASQALRTVAGQMRQPAGEYAPPPPPEYYAEEATHTNASARQAQQNEWRDEPEAPARLRGVNTPLPPEGLAEASSQRRSMSRKSMLYMGSALAVVVVGIGATLATSGKNKPGGIPTVSASKDPIKVKPEGEEASAPRPVRTVAILDKTVGTKPQQASAVSREEQPVDLSQVQGAPRGGSRVPEGEINRIVNLNSRDVTKPVASVAPQGSNPPQAGGYFPEPRKVRTVSVRPDGSVVADPQAAPRAPSIPALAAGTPTAKPSIAVPAVPAPRPQAAAVSPEKATARANRPPTVSEIARNGGEQPDTAPTATTPRPAARPAPVAERPKPAPQRVASATPASAPATTPAAASGNGTYAVQLAAPPSETEAQSTAARLRQRFASELGGRSPSVRPATVGDKTVYRVRVGGLSREDATSLCSKLQGKGGACFVAKN